MGFHPDIGAAIDLNFYRLEMHYHLRGISKFVPFRRIVRFHPDFTGLWQEREQVFFY
jgi:hypothetical protein